MPPVHSVWRARRLATPVAREPGLPCVAWRGVCGGLGLRLPIWSLSRMSRACRPPPQTIHGLSFIFLALFYIKMESDEPMAGHLESQINRVLVVAPTCENENRPSMPSMRPSSQEAVACSPTTIDCCIPPGIYRCMPWVVDCCMLVVYMPLRP